MSVRRTLAVAWLLALAPVAPAAGQDEATPALDPRLAREVRLPAAEALIDPEGRIQATLPARLVGEIVDTGASLELRLDLGTERPVECWLYREEAELAATLWRNGQASLPPEAGRRVYTVAAAVHEDVPILVSDWIQHVPGAPDEVTGLLKQMAASRAGRSVYCRHDEIGYSQSFARVFAALATTLRWSEPGPPSALYLELSLAAVGGRPVGIERLSIVEQDGGLLAERRTAFLFPVGADAVEASDGVQLEWLGTEGGLERQTLVQLRNGEMTAQVELVRQPDGGYRASGVTARERIETTPVGSSPPLSLLERHRLLARLAGKAPAEAEALQWVPELDTERFLPARFATRLALGTGEIPATLQIGAAEEGAAPPLEERMRVDASGSAVDKQVVMGRHRISLRRMTSRGELP